MIERLRWYFCCYSNRDNFLQDSIFLPSGRKVICAVGKSLHTFMTWKKNSKLSVSWWGSCSKRSVCNPSAHLWLVLEISAVIFWAMRVCPAGEEQGFHCNITLYICLYTFPLRTRYITSCNGPNYVLLASGEKTAVTWQHQRGVRWFESNLNPQTFLWMIQEVVKRCWTSFFSPASSLYLFLAMVWFQVKIAKVNLFIVLD